MTAARTSKPRRHRIDLIRCMICEELLLPAQFRRHWHEVDDEEAQIIARLAS